LILKVKSPMGRRRSTTRCQGSSLPCLVN